MTFETWLWLALGLIWHNFPTWIKVDITFVCDLLSLHLIPACLLIFINDRVQHDLARAHDVTCTCVEAHVVPQHIKCPSALRAQTRAWHHTPTRAISTACKRKIYQTVSKIHGSKPVYWCWLWWWWLWKMMFDYSFVVSYVGTGRIMMMFDHSYVVTYIGTETITKVSPTWINHINMAGN